MYFVKVLAVLLLVSLLFFQPLSAGAQERILLFSSAATVHPDSSLEVREEIVVNVEGRRIRRGIFRDFPTRFKTPSGRTVHADFAVKQALLDGRRVPHRTERRGNGVRVYLGNPALQIPCGERTFTLVYTATHQLGFFDHHDELYWNVTGNDWVFPIDEARFSLSLPGDTPVSSVEFHTGRRGAQGKAAQVLPGNSVVTTAPLRRGEGLTVVFTWPKGAVSAPKEHFFDKYHVLFLVALPIMLLAVYFLLWLRWGKDPPMPVVVPLFSPSPGRTPGFLRYVSRMGADFSCFTAEILNLAVQGYIVIEERFEERQEKKNEVTTHSYHALKRTEKPIPEAAGAEKKLLSALFAQGKTELVLRNENRTVLTDARKRLAKLFEVRGKPLFSKNTGIWCSALVVPLLGWLAMYIGGREEMAAASAFLTAVFTVVCYFVLGELVFFGELRRYDGLGFAETAARILPRAAKRLGLVLVSAAVVSIAIVVAGAGGLLVLLYELFAFMLPFVALMPILLPVTSLLMAVQIVLFHELMTIRTPEGNLVLAEAEGLTMYMETAERHRMEMLNPPDETPEFFEALFPYAFALDVADTWAQRFDDLLKTRAAAGESEYRAPWYSGDRAADLWKGTGAYGAFSAFSNSIQSASSSGRGSGSSGSFGSGSGGGGFSGGGRGGGGGGGW